MLSCLLISPLGCLIGISILTCPNKMFNTLSSLFLSKSPIAQQLGPSFPEFLKSIIHCFLCLTHHFWSISKSNWFCLQILPWFHLLFYRSIQYLPCNPPPRLLWLLKWASNPSAYFTLSSLPICCLFRHQYHLLKMSCIFFIQTL